MQKNTVWFDNIDEREISKTDFETFKKILSSSVKANKFNPNGLSLEDNNTPRIIFISIAEFPVTATVFHGQGLGILDAFENAFKKLQQRFDCSNKEYIIKIDIVSSVKPKKQYRQNSQYIFTLGVHGVAFAKEYDLAILPEQIAYNHLWNDKFEVLSNRIENYLEKNPPESHKFADVWRNREFDAYIFKTSSFLLENDNLTPLFRGQRIFETFTKQDLKSAIKLGGQYLTNVVLPNGRYEYQYYVDTNFAVRDYNFLRHAGTSFSLVEYLEFSKDKSCLPALNRALEYMKLFALPGLEDPNTVCFSERGLVKMGGAGLASLALAKYVKVTGDDKDKEFLAKICNWILTQTKENGDFIGHKQRYHDGSYSSKTCLYYPGEVIYGLTLSYHLLKEDKWIDAANRIAHWMIQVRDKGVPDLKLEHDHWLLYGLNELYRITPHQIYLEHAIKTCKAIMHRQILKNDYPDYIGAHDNRGDPSSTQAATRSEGLLAAYKLLRDFGNVPEFVEQVLQYAKRSICFQLRTQYTELTTMYVHDAPRALGGFRGALNSHDIRIDYVQHNISSLISLYGIVEG
jgi:hypothetical protein